MKDIKTERVKIAHPKLVNNIQQLLNDLTNLKLVEVKGDQSCRSLDEKFNLVKRTSEAMVKEARDLIKDAMDAELKDIVLELDNYIHTIQSDLRENEVKISDQKSELGIIGTVDPNKITDLKPPSFSGEPSDKLDFYSFQKEFQEYISTKNLSKENQFMVLQKTCLSGTARLACRNMQNETEVWDYLKTTFGNVRILCSTKMEELRKLGRCEGSSNKKREWGIQVKAKLNYLHELAIEHGIENEIYFSPVISEIQRSLPTKLQDDFKEKLRDNKGVTVTREEIFTEFLSYMEKVVDNLTFELHFELASSSSDKTLENKAHQGPKPSQSTNKPVNKPPQKKTYSASVPQPPMVDGLGSRKKNRTRINQVFTQPQNRTCSLCSNQHTHLFYCEEFQKSQIKERYKLAGKVKACFRCLRMDSEVDFLNKSAWYETHKVNCKTDFACAEINCSSRPENKQFHITMCTWHINENKLREKDFTKSLNQSLLKSGARFFGIRILNLQPSALVISTKVHPKNCEVLPDTPEDIIFMLQQVTVDKDKKLLLFYDSGCSGAAISEHAHSVLETETVRPGPTLMSVAGGTTVQIEGGDERFWLDLAGSKTRATITGLKMKQVTSPFPVWDLQQAWDEVVQGYSTDQPSGPPLPQVPGTIGGTSVDLLIGIRYSKYFPELLYTLPCGLSIYKSKFAAPDNRLGILGGPHNTWRNARNASNFFNPKIYFSNELRAYYSQNQVLRSSLGICATDPEKVPELTVPDDEDDVPEECSNEHCQKHSQEQGWTVHSNWDVRNSKYSIRVEESRFEEVENLGSELPYRCVRCRNCSDCKKGELLEKISLQEEMEQALIEGSVYLIPEQSKLVAKLPFILDPSVHIKPNISLL